MDNGTIFKTVILKTGDERLLCDIEELWKQLNQLHIEKSPDFKEYYRTTSFQTRSQGFLSAAKRGKLFISIAYCGEEKIGYVVASVVDETGEVDSIFVKPDYRNKHIGDLLMEASLNWIMTNNVKLTRIAVSVGNEEVFGFYAKYGFKPRLSVLQFIPESQEK